MKIRAAFLEKMDKAENAPLRIRDIVLPKLKDNEVLIKVNSCGVCRTDLHIVEGDLGKMRNGIIPGHEIVGTIEKSGKTVNNVKIGDRIGMAWLYSSCGYCEYCLSGRENLCKNKEFTGFSKNGGYSEYVIADGRFLFKLPKGLNNEETAPLLCSGVIGYRALKLTHAAPGSTVAMFGFGGSAHLTLQLAKRLGYKVAVVTRNTKHLKLAEKLGADFVLSQGDSDMRQSLKNIGLENAIVFAPSSVPIMDALWAIKPGGRVLVSGIHIYGAVTLDYDLQLFHEKTLQSVESYTREDMIEYLNLAENLSIKPVYDSIKLEDINSALLDLKNGRVNGVKVIKF